MEIGIESSQEVMPVETRRQAKKRRAERARAREIARKEQAKKYHELERALLRHFRGTVDALDKSLCGLDVSHGRSLTKPYQRIVGALLHLVHQKEYDGVKEALHYVMASTEDMRDLMEEAHGTRAAAFLMRCRQVIHVTHRMMAFYGKHSELREEGKEEECFDE